MAQAIGMSDDVRELRARMKDFIDNVVFKAEPELNRQAEEGFHPVTGLPLELYEAAVAAGVLTIDRPASFADFDLFQPHQLRKRRAVWARLKGMEIAGKPVPQVTDLGLEDCARQNSLAENLSEGRGARERAKRGRLGEPRPVPRAEG